MTSGRTPSIPTHPPVARVGDTTPPVGFLQFWSAWHEKVWAVDSALAPLGVDEQCKLGAKGVTHLIPSLGGVRVGCRVSLPKERPSGAVIELHGYGMDPGAPLRGTMGYVRRGQCHVELRVRGYPGSQIDCGDLLGTRGGYITVGLTDPASWIVGMAAADVVSAFRALRREYGPEFPISLRGESFGGALAIIAASSIASRDLVHRLAIGVPTLGDWGWRLAHPEFCGGAGEQILNALPTDPEAASEVLRTLRLFDVAVHARRITCPVLCKMAYCDPVVAPSTTAAIYNALGAGPGWKWRFMTSYAHMDSAGHPGATDDLRRHALFEQLCEEFLDPSEYPQTLMMRWESKLAAVSPVSEE